MLQATVEIDVSQQPELRALAESVQRSGARHLLRSDGEVLAVIEPVARARRRGQGKRTSAADPIWRIVGIASAAEPSDVSEHVDEYLAAAEIDASRP